MLIALLVVVTVRELQKGQAFGASKASGGWMYTRLTSQCCGPCCFSLSRCCAIH